MFILSLNCPTWICLNCVFLLVLKLAVTGEILFQTSHVISGLSVGTSDVAAFNLSLIAFTHVGT